MFLLKEKNFTIVKYFTTNTIYISAFKLLYSVFVVVSTILDIILGPPPPQLEKILGALLQRSDRLQFINHS